MVTITTPAMAGPMARESTSMLELRLCAFGSSSADTMSRTNARLTGFSMENTRPWTRTIP